VRYPEWLNGLTLAYVLIYALGAVLTAMDNGFAGVHDPNTDCLRNTRRRWNRYARLTRILSPRRMNPARINSACSSWNSASCTRCITVLQ